MSLKARLDKLDGGSKRNDASGLARLTDDEIEDRIIAICKTIIADPVTTEESRAEAQAKIDAIHAEWASWAAYWKRPDVAEAIAAKIAAGHLKANWTPPRCGNGV